uniref:Cupin domain-containing protein n=1 Tax=Thermorudis peleae TaxID=1382356 RepID=A0A831T929_9BACT
MTELFAQVKVSYWEEPGQPTEDSIFQRMIDEGLMPYRWANGPGDVYPPHRHPYHKVLYVARGSIRFELHPGGAIDLYPGDRLDLPPGIEHSAVVGPEGVVCLEAHVLARSGE